MWGADSQAVQKVAPGQEAGGGEATFPTSWHLDIMLSPSHLNVCVLLLSCSLALVFKCLMQPADVKATFPWHHQVSSHTPLFPAGRLVILSAGQYFLGSADNAQSPLCCLQTCQKETQKRTSHLLYSYLLQPRWGLRQTQALRRENTIGQTWACVLPFLKGDDVI